MSFKFLPLSYFARNKGQRSANDGSEQRSHSDANLFIRLAVLEARASKRAYFWSFLYFLFIFLLYGVLLGKFAVEASQVQVVVRMELEEIAIDSLRILCT